jgi:hypothetical protein
MRDNVVPLVLLAIAVRSPCSVAPPLVCGLPGDAGGRPDLRLGRPAAADAPDRGGEAPADLGVLGG